MITFKTSCVSRTFSTSELGTLSLIFAINSFRPPFILLATIKQQTDIKPEQIAIITYTTNNLSLEIGVESRTDRKERKAEPRKNPKFVNVLEGAPCSIVCNSASVISNKEIDPTRPRRITTSSESCFFIAASLLTGFSSAIHFCIENSSMLPPHQTLLQKACRFLLYVHLA